MCLRCSIFFVLITSLSISSWALSPVFQLTEGAEAVDVANGYLYAGGETQLSIFSLANPAQPALVSQIPVVQTYDLSVVGNRLYIVMHGEGTQSNPNPLNFWIVDVTNPANPVVLKRLHVGEAAQGVHATEKWVGIATSHEGVWIVDPNAAAGPTWVGTIEDVGAPAYDVFIRGDRMYVGAEFKLAVYDISAPANPVALDEVTFDGYGVDLAAEGDVLAVAEEWDGVGIYDISNPDKLTLCSHKTYPSVNRFDQVVVWGIDIWNRYVYATLLSAPNYDPAGGPGDNGGLSVLNALFPSNASESANDRFEGDMVDVVARDGYVYAGMGRDGIKVYQYGGGLRVTPTPTQPSPTPTPTFTLTPTSTPPSLVTPTPGISKTFTPTHTLAPTPLPSVPPSPTVKPTSTPIIGPSASPTSALVPTSTPVSGAELQLLFSSRFDRTFVQEDGWTPMLPFAGQFQTALYTIGNIPMDNTFTGATDGRGLHIMLTAGQAVTLLGSPVMTSGLPVLIRVTVRADKEGGQIGLAALDSNVVGSVISYVPANTVSCVNRYRRLQFVYKPDSTGILPILQVIHLQGDVVNVYLDNFEIYAIPAGASVSGAMLGADGNGL
ncbi:MAG TPA: hypothetical protein PLQ35_13415 [bacterium]|nr:hypothetical protein [bacterium]HQL63284.1 hypothetical protein [bacterium]